MKKMLNSEMIEGRLYSHNLEVKTVQDTSKKTYGTEYITGNIEVATDDAMLNVISVRIPYVTETTSTGKVSPTYNALVKIINEGKTILKDGPEDATKLKINTSLAVNDFYTQDDRLVSTKVNQGGFVTVLNANAELSPENERNTFTADMVITSVIRTEADEEKNIDKDFLTVKGAIFDFRGALLPVDFVVENEKGMEYFESLNASQREPIFTKLWGKIKSSTVTYEKTEETAFGEAAVKTYERKTKKWVITGAAKEVYDFDDESTITVAELQKAMQDRELLLADIKKRREEGTKVSQPVVKEVTVQVAKTDAKFDF